MITEVVENEFGLYISIKPETPSEVAMLVRHTINAKSAKPGVYMSFSTDPYLDIVLDKRKKSVQNNSIKPS